MKALTVRLPWASLIEAGAKRIETRSWQTRYRGPLAIHAGLTFTRRARALCEGTPFREGLAVARRLPNGDLPRGMVLATCDLVAVVPVGPGRVFPAQLSERERAYGDYSDGRYAWVLSNIRPLPEPAMTKGALGLWEWREEAA